MLQLNPDSAAGTVVKDGLEIPVLRIGESTRSSSATRWSTFKPGEPVTFAGAPG
ncbi:hypothetical protein [Amycolatopsis sp. DG1A-15b]|uniref:hypothetical protein n=1 Tax=Amycolatopsis sp. DG1A-15b TaxID=3052846 RepID=UPI00255BB2DE|nr:hypothetical protein [Amycolatopsis sp. DG1A-15b]WIX90019.1 hypothetical protein QRY02_06120 [Amycolatopsis sp. DG1A-15b]